MNLEKKLYKAIKSNNIILIDNIFEDIYKEYYSLIYFIVSKYESNKQNVEELINDVFFTFYKASTKTKIDNIKYYLVVCAKNVTLDFLKKQKLDIIYDDEIILNQINLNNNLKYSETISKIEKILTEYEMNIIILHDVYNYSFKDLANKYNKKLSSISSTYHRAIKKIISKEKINEF